jgi:hypothetical protein
MIGHSWRSTLVCVIAIAAPMAFVASAARAQVDVLTNHNDNYRTGANLGERVLTPENVNRTQFGMLFKRMLDDQLYTQPLVATHVTVGGGTHDIVYVTTVNNSVYAFDAVYDARTLAQVSVFNTSPGGSRASIWQSGQGPAADDEGNVYVVTGNGSWDGVRDFSETFLKRNPRLGLIDWFTPTNHVELDAKDADLNSSGPSLIPGTHVVLGGDKEGILYALDTRNVGHLGDEHALQHFKATASHMHSLVYWTSASHGPLLFVWGQRDKARVYRIDGEKLVETPAMTRDLANAGHPGAMLSLSADGNRNGILWAAIHATGDSWHKSRPGILHAYDADDIRRALWNSLEMPTRDDCGEYSKMAPPTIANGKVYLASFGTENIGTGQFCVYGLLPAKGAVALPAPANAKAEISNGMTMLSWNAVPGATHYRVILTTALEPIGRTVATGLTAPSFSDPAPERGESATYAIIAVGQNGVSAPSESVVVSVPRPKPRMAP